LFAAGLQQLLHREGDEYYSDVLVARRPASVLRLADRKEQLAIEPGSPVLALDDASSDVSCEVTCPIADAQRGVAECSNSDDDLLPAPRIVAARREGQVGKKRRLNVADVVERLAASGDAAPPQIAEQIVHAPAPLTPVAEPSPAPLGDDEGVCIPAAPSAGGVVRYRGVSYIVLSDRLPEYVSGLRLEREIRVESGRAGHTYDRIGVTCPLAGCDHGNRCHRWRSLNMTAKEKKPIFGNVEAAAYLGVWLNHAHEFLSRDTHMAFEPKFADVVVFLGEHGFIRRA
jgi:hypothetical protein